MLGEHSMLQSACQRTDCLTTDYLGKINTSSGTEFAGTELSIQGVNGVPRENGVPWENRALCERTECLVRERNAVGENGMKKA